MIKKSTHMATENPDPVNPFIYPFAFLLVILDQVLAVVEAIFPSVHLYLPSARTLNHI